MQRIKETSWNGMCTTNNGPQLVYCMHRTYLWAIAMKFGSGTHAMQSTLDAVEKEVLNSRTTKDN